MAVDLRSHVGLRGVAAVWVMVFHCVLYSKYPIDLQGSSLMPMFFLLSGFSLMVTYGDQPRGINSDGESKKLNVGDFYRNRLARTFPTYYACLGLALPLWFSGYGSVSPSDMSAITASIITSVLPLCTLFIFMLGSCIDGPGWTICTLAIMWLIFPFSVKGIKEKTNEQLVAGIVLMYWVQLLVLVIVFVVLLVFIGFWPAFCAATMNPITRYPIFLMGMYAGELCTRSVGKRMLWPSSLFGFPGCDCCCRREEGLNESDPQQALWTNRTDRNSIGLLVVTLLVTVIDALLKYTTGNIDASILGAVWLQALVPFAQLEVIVSFTRDGGLSRAAKFLDNAKLKFLGAISMCIYLVHYPLIYYLCWMVQGHSLTWPDFDCTQYPSNSAAYDQCQDAIDSFNDARRIPMWGIPVVVCWALVLAVLLFYGVEEPCRKLLRTSSASKQGRILVVASASASDEETIAQKEPLNA